MKSLGYMLDIFGQIYFDKKMEEGFEVDRI